jgi:hypothetical protein
MLEVICDNCGDILALDEISTFEDYKKDHGIILKEDGTLSEESIPTYIVFKCLSCNSLYKLTYEEWFEKVKFKIAESAMHARRLEIFKEHINPYIIDPDNGLEFCGKCPGIDNEGNCYVDIIKQCPIRRL